MSVNTEGTWEKTITRMTKRISELEYDNTKLRKRISELEDKFHYCKCGDRVNNPDDICGHGVADGRCCICDLCRKELEKEDDEEEQVVESVEVEEEKVICPYCDEEVDEEESEQGECPTFCAGECGKVYHAQCARKGSIRYLEAEEEDYCYECFQEGASEEEPEEEEEYTCGRCERIVGTDCLFGECQKCNLIMCDDCEGVIDEDDGETYCNNCHMAEEEYTEEYTEELLKKKKCPELRKICKSKKIRGYSRKKKQELINLIVNKNN